MKRAIVSWTAGLGLVVLSACGGSGGGTAPAGAQIDLSEARVFFELNATDEDLGFHTKFDGQGWQQMQVFDINGAEVFSVTNGGSLNQLGSTEVFTESAEPPFSELDPAVFLTMFPEGT